MKNRSLPSVGQSHFANVPSANMPRSTFDRSHGYKTTFDSGYLVPVFVDEALPGDTFTINMTHFARMTTPLVPLMDNMFVDVFFFAVPNRLVWDNWQKFCGEQIDPGDSTDFLVPQMTPNAGGYSEGSLSDYFGLPTLEDFGSHSSLWHRAYNLIYNEWFRDQNLQDSVVVDRDDGPDDPDDYVLLRRCKKRDYFTSALPWTQKGPAVLLPLGDRADVLGIGLANVGNTPVTKEAWESDGVFRESTRWQVTQNVAPIPSGETNMWVTRESASVPDIYADLSTATAATINQLRQAFQVQRMFERDARGGTRYIEILRSHFRVLSPDARLQRPEYIGGYSSMVNINPIAQTSSTDTTTPQGNLAAVGTSSNSKGVVNKSFVEHNLIIGLINVRADLTYQQGLNRMWSRQTRFDYYWPALAHLGEQAVLSKEIYATGDPEDDDAFGYQERYAEYRYKPTQITGQFRSNFAQSLDSWHLSQDFATRPVLNASFIQDNPPIDRVIAVESYPQFFLDVYFRFKCTRPMPMYSVPGLIDHF